MTVLQLYDPDFWKKFFEDVRTGSDHNHEFEFELLAQVAANAGVSYSFARQRVNDFLAGRLEEKLQNPYAPDDPHQVRGNDTLH
jgi:hypothetical protein